MLLFGLTAVISWSRSLARVLFLCMRPLPLWTLPEHKSFIFSPWVPAPSSGLSWDWPCILTLGSLPWWEKSVWFILLSPWIDLPCCSSTCWWMAAAQKPFNGKHTQITDFFISRQSYSTPAGRWAGSDLLATTILKIPSSASWLLVIPSGAWLADEGGAGWSSPLVRLWGCQVSLQPLDFLCSPNNLLAYGNWGLNVLLL